MTENQKEHFEERIGKMTKEQVDRKIVAAVHAIDSYVERHGKNPKELIEQLEIILQHG